MSLHCKLKFQYSTKNINMAHCETLSVCIVRICEPKMSLQSSHWCLPGPAAVDGADRIVGAAEGPGSVVGINEIILWPPPVAMAPLKLNEHLSLV